MHHRPSYNQNPFVFNNSSKIDLFTTVYSTVFTYWFNYIQTRLQHLLFPMHKLPNDMIQNSTSCYINLPYLFIFSYTFSFLSCLRPCQTSYFLHVNTISGITWCIKLDFPFPFFCRLFCPSLMTSEWNMVQLSWIFLDVKFLSVFGNHRLSVVYRM